MIKTITLNNVVYTVDDSADIPPHKAYYSILTNSININTNRVILGLTSPWDRFLVISCSDPREAARLGVPVTVGEERTYTEADLKSAMKYGMTKSMIQAEQFEKFFGYLKHMIHNGLNESEGQVKE